MRLSMFVARETNHWQTPIPMRAVRSFATLSRACVRVGTMYLIVSMIYVDEFERESTNLIPVSCAVILILQHAFGGMNSCFFRSYLERPQLCVETNCLYSTRVSTQPSGSAWCVCELEVIKSLMLDFAALAGQDNRKTDIFTILHGRGFVRKP